MKLLGYNVHVWDPAEQSKLVLEAVLPVVTAFDRQGSLVRFVFDRFDARGPHLFLIVGVAEPAAESAREQLDTSIHHHLKTHPPNPCLDGEVLKKRHEACRGKSLCDADIGDDLCDLGHVERFAATEADYPFMFAKKLSDPDGFWRTAATLPIWTCEQVRSRPGAPALAAALHWLSVFEQRLQANEVDVQGYFRYHACTLVMVLPQRLEEEPEGEVVASVSKAVSAKNRQVFDSIWERSRNAEDPWPGLTELALRVATAGDRAAQIRIVREVVHMTLKQLGLPVSLHIPIVLYGWSRHALPEEDAS